MLFEGRKNSPSNRSDTMEFKVLDLFCGAGGFSSGLDKVENIKTVAAVDFDKYATETFKNNFPEATVFTGDLTNPAVKQKIIETSKNLGVNMIVGGPPCQGFSLKGKNLGMDDPRNFLFLEFFHLVKEIKPEVFVIENVKNLLNSENGYFKNQIIEKFSSLGYILNYSILNAKDFSVPESRERAIIIGSLSYCVNMPQPHNDIITVRDAISDLAYLNSGEGSFESDYLTAPQSQYQKDLRGKKLYNHVATNHSDVALKKLSMIPAEGDKTALPKELHGKQKFSTTWARLRWDTFSPTIDTRFDTPSNGRNSHPFLNRAITPREAARIQSFDDDFIFLGSKCAVCRQIGNAVPPRLGKAIGEAVVLSYQKKTNTATNYRIMNGDAYSLIKELKKENLKVNHIITDPPYNISKSNNFSTMKNPRKGVNFGNWDFDFDLYSWIPEYVDILDKNGSMIIFCSYRFISQIINELERNQMVVKDVLIWQKSNPMPRNINRRYVQDSEFAIWAVKEKSAWVFNKPIDVPYLRAFYKTSTVAGKERTKHPTQKSLALMEQIIEVHTNPNEIILDPFMGSGTTGVAALNKNRNFIGIELDPEYYDIALNRIKNI